MDVGRWPIFWKTVEDWSKVQKQYPAYSWMCKTHPYAWNTKQNEGDSSRKTKMGFIWLKHLNVFHACWLLQPVRKIEVSLIYARFTAQNRRKNSSMVYFHSITKQMRRQSQLSEKHNPSDIQSAWLRVHYFKINSGPLTHNHIGPGCFPGYWQGSLLPFYKFPVLHDLGLLFVENDLQYHWLPPGAFYPLDSLDQNKPWIPHTPQFRPPVLTSLLSNGVCFGQIYDH